MTQVTKGRGYHPFAIFWFRERIIWYLIGPASLLERSLKSESNKNNVNTVGPNREVENPTWGLHTWIINNRSKIYQIDLSLIVDVTH
jgi:hypothetical protein